MNKAGAKHNFLEENFEYNLLSIHGPSNTTTAYLQKSPCRTQADESRLPEYRGSRKSAESVALAH